MDMINNILGATSRSGSSSTHRGGTTTTTTTNATPPDGFDTSASHRSGSYSSDGSSTHSDGKGNIYTIDADGNVTSVLAPPVTATRSPQAGNPNGDTNITAAEDEEDNTLLWLGVLATFGLCAWKFVKSRKKGRRK